MCVARWVPRDATMSEVGDMFDERRWEMPRIDTEIVAGVRGVVLLRVSPRRWRVLDRTGRVLGHLRAEDGTLGVRFHAERFDLAAARMRDLGAFWTARDAVDCLRYLR